MARPAAATAKAMKVARPPMPSAFLAATVYDNGGHIYTAHAKRCFRVMRTSGDRVDKCVAWKDDPAYVWKRSLDAIDEARGLH